MTIRLLIPVLPLSLFILCGILFLHRWPRKLTSWIISDSERVDHRGRDFVFEHLMLAAFALYLVGITVCFMPIYQVRHLTGTLYLFCYGVLPSFAVYLLYRVWTDLQTQASQARDHRESGAPLPEYNAILKPRLRRLDLVVIPRPYDFYTKMLLFLIGIVIAIVEGYEPVTSTIALRLFNHSSNVSPSVLYIIASVLVWYFIQEGLIQQSKYLWNDLRDHASDQEFENKRDRAVASGILTRNEAIAQMVVRLFGGLLLSWLLDRRLFMISLGIFIIHLLYELVGKPNGNRIPILPLILVALGSPMRIVGGTASISTGFFDARYALYFLAFTLYGVGYLGVFWKIEAVYTKQKGITKLPRPHSNYYYRNGDVWRDLGFVGMFIASGLLFADATFWQSNGINALFRKTVSSIRLFSAGFTQLLVYTAFTVGFLGLITLLMVPLSKVLSRTFSASHVSRISTFALLTLAAVRAFVTRAAGLRAFPVEILIMALALFMYSRFINVTYEEFMMTYMQSNWKRVFSAMRSFVANAENSMGLGQLIRVTWQVLTADAEITDTEWNKMLHG